MLTQLSTVKARLAIPEADTTNDALLTSAIKAVSPRFDKETNRTLTRTVDFSQEFPADDTELSATCYPIESVTKFELKTTEAEGWQEQSPIPDFLLRKSCIIPSQSHLPALGAIWTALYRSKTAVSYLTPQSTCSRVEGAETSAFRDHLSWQAACYEGNHAAEQMILRVVPKSLPGSTGAEKSLSRGKASRVDGKHRAARKSQGGGSLVEVIVATCILAIAGSGIISSINYGMFMMRLARENARATQILLEKTEALRMYNWNQLVYSNGFLPTAFTAVYDPQAATNAQGAVYTGSISNGPVAFSTSYSGKMRQCTVSVQWTSVGRINHSRSLTTYIAADGVQNYVY